ncbi:hypothetical protein ACU81Q_10290 [Komagataeibacter melomenusus]
MMPAISIDWERLDPMLRQMAGMGVSVSTMARKMGVSSRAVRSRMQVLGVSNQVSVSITSSGRTWVGRARVAYSFRGRRSS